MTSPDPIKRKAREIVTQARTCPHREAVASVEASLRVVAHDAFMRGERMGRCEALTEAIGNDGSEREDAA